MDVFSPQRKQEVLENLFKLATEEKSTTVAAIKLYLELADSTAPADTLTLEHALQLLRQNPTEPPQDEPSSAKTKKPKAAR